jgi:outer membrane receptor protein involved in Fe transport
MLSRICAAFLLASSLVVSSAIAQVSLPNANTIEGRILETSAGLPVGGAEVRLLLGSATVDTTTTGPDGTFSFKGVAPGSYTMEISARGYLTTHTQPLPVAAGIGTVEFQTAIAPQTAGLREIANVSVASRTSLSTSATINSNLSPVIIQDQNYIRAGDALGTLPFVTSSTSSSLGDDETLSLRGFDPTESVTMLDGHPIGPIGAYGTAFDYQFAQFWGLSNINVIYGSGAAGLYGVPSLAGAVDFETINPTPQNHVTLIQGYGDLGKAMTGLQYTGTAGRLGFAMAYGVQGTDGEIDQSVTQTGDLAGFEVACPDDPTTAAYAANPTINSGAPPPTIKAADEAACDYHVGGAYTNRNIVGKLTYQVDSKTALLVSVWNSSMYAESSGNGDTDDVPYVDALYVANGIISGGTNNFQLLNGSMTACSSTTIAALSDTPAGYSCLTAKQYAQDFNGPQGAGPDRFHTGLLQDYHARLTRRIGSGTLAFDGFVNNYDYLNIKGLPPAKAEQDTWLTHGASISDEYAGSKSDFSFGVNFLHQLHETNQENGAIPGLPTYIFGPPDYGLFITDTNYFIHENYAPSDRFSLFADLTMDRSQDTSTTNFDPRLSFVFRPTNNDVFRLTGGRATSEPDPSLITGGFTFEVPYSQNASFNPKQNCVPLVPLASGASPYVKPESANDVEVALAHRFSNRATIEIDLYDTVEQNPILSAVYPLSIVPASEMPGAAYFNSYITALTNACGAQFSLNDFGASAPFNAGHADYRGGVASVNVPITRQFELDGDYVVQSAYYTGLNTEVLENNPSLINNQQFFGVPLHTASLGVGYNNLRGGLTARIDGYYVGINNGFDRPAYYYANANASKTVGPITLNLGIANLFNSAANPYGFFGLGVPTPINQFGSGATALAQGAEEFGLPYRQIWMTTTFHF